MCESEDQVLSEAYAVQDACNLSGVVHSFADVCSFLMSHKHDSATIRQHSAVLLFADKIADMLGRKEFPPSEAWERCRAAYSRVHPEYAGR